MKGRTVRGATREPTLDSPPALQQYCSVTAQLVIYMGELKRILSYTFKFYFNTFNI